MFKEMVPEYVIPRMLNKEVIADPRSTVTVLFVLIDNFGDYTRTAWLLSRLSFRHALVNGPHWSVLKADGCAGRNKIRRAR